MGCCFWKIHSSWKKRLWRGKEKGAPWSLRCSPTVGTGMTSVAWKNILDMPTTPAHPYHSNPLPSFLALASLDVPLGRASWGHCHCLHVKQSPSEGRERKQRASHGTSQEQKWLPQPSPLRPLFWLRGAGVTPVPLSPPVFLLLPPCNPFFSALVPCSHPENAPFFPERALWMSMTCQGS